MNRIIVVSDTHLRKDILKGIINNHPDINTLIHCGDNIDDTKAVSIKNIYSVAGNHDYHYNNILEVAIIGKVTFLIIHGHKHCIEYGVDTDYQNIIDLAKQRGATIICHGHTHQAFTSYIDDILIVNPGSIAYPRGGLFSYPTYAILTINDENSVKVEFYHAKTFELLDKDNRHKKSNKESFFAKIFK